jgi:hypothetical protein
MQRRRSTATKATDVNACGAISLDRLPPPQQRGVVDGEPERRDRKRLVLTEYLGYSTSVEYNSPHGWLPAVRNAGGSDGSGARPGG